ncbi:hypothetical protein OS493_012974 [Desmophyllum pertusum]|uniref:Uncharacterized protein n=1 Tax=Desmophyllum pertusum TaxID=174260 RepID=A0A9W9Z1D9_9CNID|nr:hypothetical protein OS493_012974 [Desmophyllum pertusum]
MASSYVYQDGVHLMPEFPESPPVTSTGYGLMINASSTEYNIIYTIMKNVQKMMYREYSGGVCVVLQSGKYTSKLFHFWSNYIDMAMLLGKQDITKANVTTFASLSKKVKIRRAEEKKVTDRRQKLVWSLTSRGKEPSHRLEGDRYDNPHSTKGGEREQRGVSSAPEIHINSGKTPIPKQWTKYMSSPAVKKTQMVRDKVRDGNWLELKPGKRLLIGGDFVLARASS